ncbi:MAG: hypothetical protein IT437_04350 [Phycisphaerales bacterium]|nr:hypothetical protein [Phycisphaerales bacterium]
MNIGVRGRVWVVAAGLLASAGLALGQNAGTTVLVVERAAAGDFLVDAKDQGLARAFGMLPARLGELPREIPNFPPEATGMINILLAAASHPASLAVRYDADNPSGAAFGYGLVASVKTATREEAEAMQSRVSALLASHNAPTEANLNWATMADIATPAGPVTFGPREVKPGQWNWQIIFGNVANPDFAAATLPEPAKGMKTLIQGRLDFAGLTPIFDMAEGMVGGSNPQADEFFKGMREAGMVGDDAVKVRFQVGYTDEDSRSITVWEGARQHMKAWHMTETPLTKGELAAIPADPTFAFLAKGDLAWLQDMMDNIAAQQPQAEEGFNQFKQATGVDLRNDIFGTLGGALGAYASDATGGGSLGSIVALISFKDRPAFMAASEKLRNFANSMADQAPLGPGYIRVTPWKDGETDLVSLRFPGLPVPLELTYAATKEWLVVGLTPQGVIAAARQASGKGDAGLGSGEGFRAGLPKGHELVSVSYFDTSRAMKCGFPIISLLGSALSNAVRSPGDAGRDPGLVVPTFGELAKGARPQVRASYWRDNDLVTETRGDRSLLVNAAAGAGVVTQVAPLVAIPALIAAGEERHREMGLLGASPQAWALAAFPTTFVPSAPSPAMLGLAISGARLVQPQVEGVAR